jgi:transcriptional regulator with XRE-family HTH domain
MTAFEKRRLEFVDQLRQRREQAGLSGIELADALGWTNSKVSKIERGRQTPSDGDVLAWLDALDTPTHEVAALRDQLRQLRVEQVTWRRQVREGHRQRQQQDLIDEQAATTIRAVDTAAVPGLLQTPDYARHIFQSQAALLGTATSDIDESVRVRMQRQAVLYDSGKTIKILMPETALANPVCPPDVLRGQLDRLTMAVGLPNVEFRILPTGQTVPHVLWHGYWIVDDVVLIETITNEHRISDPDQVATYNTLTDRLWEQAAERDNARAVLATIAASRRDEPTSH